MRATRSCFHSPLPCVQHKPRPNRQHFNFQTRHRVAELKDPHGLACVAGEADEDCRMALLPIMALVKPGTEPLVPADLFDLSSTTRRPAKVRLWDRRAPAMDSYKRLVTYLGNVMLTDGSKGGRGSQHLHGFEQFLLPQTACPSHTAVDQHCHMPAKTVFPANSPLHKDSSS